MTDAHSRIADIDRLIDANRRALLMRVRFDPSLSAAQWQRAWDRCPDLWARDRELFRQRGEAQEERDAQIHREWMRQQRQRRAAEQRARKSDELFLSTFAAA